MHSSTTPRVVTPESLLSEGAKLREVIAFQVAREDARALNDAGRSSNPDAETIKPPR